jgi:hypothetical protein
MENNYTDEIETVLENIRCNSVLLYQEHRQRYLQLKAKLKYYKVPIIIISSISSIVSLSQQFLDQNVITLLNMILGLVCSIIGSIELFFGISNQLIKEYDTSKDFHILGMSIFKCLSLQRIDRPQNGTTFLENSYGTYIKLIETSNILPSRIQDKLCDIPPIPYFHRNNTQDLDWDENGNINLLELRHIDRQENIHHTPRPYPSARLTMDPHSNSQIHSSRNNIPRILQNRPDEGGSKVTVLRRDDAGSSEATARIPYIMGGGSNATTVDRMREAAELPHASISPRRSDIEEVAVPEDDSDSASDVFTTDDIHTTVNETSI